MTQFVYGESIGLVKFDTGNLRILLRVGDTSLVSGRQFYYAAGKGMINYRIHNTSAFCETRSAYRREIFVGNAKRGLIICARRGIQWRPLRRPFV